MWRTVWDEFSAQARIAPRSVAIPDVAEAGHVRDITYAELAVWLREAQRADNSANGVRNVPVWSRPGQRLS